MDGAVGGLLLRREEGLDLVVGAVDRPGAAGLVLAFATELQRGLGKGGFTVGRCAAGGGRRRIGACAHAAIIAPSRDPPNAGIGLCGADGSRRITVTFSPGVFYD